MFGGRPIEPPVMLAVRAVASRTTRMSRWVYVVIEVRLAGPKSYFQFRSASTNVSVKGSLIWVKSWRSPSVTAGRGAVEGLDTEIEAEQAFPPPTISLRHAHPG